MAVSSGYQGLLGPTRATGTGELPFRSTGEGAQYIDQVSGQYAARTYSGAVHEFSVLAVTVPVVASGLVSVCGIYNPPGSGRILEVIDTVIHNVVAATIVQTFMWVSSTVALSALATFTTAGTARNRRMQDPSSTVARVYTAVTHSGTPDREAYITGHGATTNTGYPNYRVFNGTLMIPPGVLASVCATTAASTASGEAVEFSWADIPL